MDRNAEPSEGAALPFKYGSVITPPRSSSEWPAWREQLEHWREGVRAMIDYDGSAYERSEYTWVPASPSFYSLKMWDKRFMDAEKGTFDTEALLNHGVSRVGGFDIVLLWPAYPQLGFDDRNQFDFMRGLPGGLPALRRFADVCHERSVRVFVPYNPWDIGTRREPMSDLDALCQLVLAIDADGIFLDTMTGAPFGLRGALDAVRPGVVLEPECAFQVDVDSVETHHMELGPFSGWESGAPVVLRNKWFERGHMHHIGSSDMTAAAHLAWMNGSGLHLSETNFGVPDRWCPRDLSILRAMFPIQRRYARLFSGERWVPLVETKVEGIYASLWEADGLRLWTLVNRSENLVDGPLMQVSHRARDQYFDLIAGQRLQPNAADGQVELEGTIRPGGIGAFLAGRDEALGQDLPQFLAQQADIDARADLNSTVFEPAEVLKPVNLTRRYTNDKLALPSGMVPIPAVTYRTEVRFTVRECLLYDTPELEGLTLRFGPEGNAHKTHVYEREVKLSAFAMDVTPVTNRQFYWFLQATGYQPACPERFLQHWLNGAPSPGKEDHPVVYVDLEDARAYARWAGKRLPTEEEWQWAAEGPERLLYPWGNKMRPGVCNDGSSGTTTPVTAFHEGRSPFGCYDMCGNVWHWTESERSNDITRFCILKGGCYYKAEGSYWYADGGIQPCSFVAKYILTWPGLDRCATVGFRCVVDLKDD